MRLSVSRVITCNMPRCSRIIMSGVPLHLIQRGNRQNTRTSHCSGKSLTTDKKLLSANGNKQGLCPICLFHSDAWKGFLFRVDNPLRCYYNKVMQYEWGVIKSLRRISDETLQLDRTAKARGPQSLFRIGTDDSKKQPLFVCDALK